MTKYFEKQIRRIRYAKIVVRVGIVVYLGSMVMVVVIGV